MSIFDMASRQEASIVIKSRMSILREALVQTIDRAIAAENTVKELQLQVQKLEKELENAEQRITDS